MTMEELKREADLAECCVVKRSEWEATLNKA